MKVVMYEKDWNDFNVEHIKKFFAYDKNFKTIILYMS